MDKVVLGMSGGVDSSVAALLLQKKGYEVHGFFMNAGKHKRKYWPSSINWREEERIVGEICEKLGIELYVVDCEDSYEKNIIGPMVEDYKKGLTPNPDILCNNIGKFPGLIKRADAIGAKHIATGHYARVRKTKNGIQLLQGMDKSKDQSYFICNLPQKILERCLFPIGDYTKEEIRKIAKKNGFSNFDKKSSRGICYLGKIDVKKVLHSRVKEKRGKVVSIKGEVVGRHPGVMFFTIGERVGEKKGFEIFPNYKKRHAGDKLYIAEKKRNNILVIAPQGDNSLKRKKVFINGFKLVNKDETLNGLKARIRHLGKLESGKLSKRNGKWVFEFSNGIEGIAEGQTIVIHKGNRIVACGEIRI